MVPEKIIDNLIYNRNIFESPKPIALNYFDDRYYGTIFKRGGRRSKGILEYLNIKKYDLRIILKKKKAPTYTII